MIVETEMPIVCEKIIFLFAKLLFSVDILLIKDATLSFVTRSRTQSVALKAQWTHLKETYENRHMPDPRPLGVCPQSVF